MRSGRQKIDNHDEGVAVHDPSCLRGARGAASPPQRYLSKGFTMKMILTIKPGGLYGNFSSPGSLIPDIRSTDASSE
jgi:hypothetical protein